MILMHFCMAVPVAGNRSTWFSVEINHGGHFVGHGRNRGYVDGREFGSIS